MKQLTLIFSLFIVIFALSASVEAQRTKANKNSSAAVKPCGKRVKTDWKFAGLAEKGSGERIDAGDKFSAFSDCNDVVVEVPGAFLDTISSSAISGFGVQIAAEAFLRVCAADAKNREDALDNYFLGMKSVKQGSGDTFTEYSFKLKNGRKASIFVYFNELSGLLAVIKPGR